ncbi:hypothetical protein [Prauserella muralis]|uniref:DUF8129 domain-containing protein n=1 Tax=Prauserella muralis TaxID=588067 RepID=A0A2V4AGJ8_9PSEU|nr:hypothetical protein [Prauserella muralis]PXY19045.1 hypothetical protein BAY60_29975 [Prauserella muralis]TWE28941.1 hypothetical protein FHX69_1610 [Prauserella muralis]
MTAQDRENLPLADYDHLPVPALRDRIRSLSRDEIEQLREYERAHASRAPVLTAMDARIEQLEQGATPSSGEHDVRPEQSPPTRHGSKGSQVNADSGGEPVHPPPHGVPAQPADPKADKRH